jgi:hypothetical protein
MTLTKREISTLIRLLEIFMNVLRLRPARRRAVRIQAAISQPRCSA